MPKLTYHLAVVTLVQFLTIMLLGIPDTLINIFQTCHSDSSNCVSNLVVSIIYYIMTAVWFAIIMLVGYTAQRRRSRQFTVILVGLELVTLVVAGYIDFPHATDWPSKATSFLDAILSVWIIFLAFRMFLAGGRRMVTKRPLRKITRNR